MERRRSEFWVKKGSEETVKHLFQQMEIIEKSDGVKRELKSMKTCSLIHGRQQKEDASLPFFS